MGHVHTQAGAIAEVVESGAPEWRRSGVGDNDDMEKTGSHRDPVDSISPNHMLKRPDSAGRLRSSGLAVSHHAQ